MQIREFFNKYTDEIALIYLYQRAVNSSANKAFEALIKHAEIVNSDPGIQEKTFISTHCMTFRDAKYGKLIIFKRGKNSIDDEKLAIELLENKNLQWLLAEANEHFEIFIENAYAFAGYIDINAWLLKDFDKITIQDLKEKDFQWYLDRVKKSEHIKLDYILKQFVNYLPEIKKVETTNYFNINLNLILIFIKHLRNTIVHHKGEVLDKDEFINEVFNKASLAKKGKQAIADKEYLEEFFGSGKYKNLINMLNLRDKENPHLHYNTLEELISYQIAYANLLTNCLEIKASVIRSDAS